MSQKKKKGEKGSALYKYPIIASILMSYIIKYCRYTVHRSTPTKNGMLLTLVIILY